MEYSLYVGEIQNIPDGVRFSYYNPDHKYLLILSQEKPDGDFMLVTGEPLNALSTAEREWLIRCEKAIAVEYMKEHKESYISMMEQFIDRFEKELETEVSNGERSGRSGSGENNE